MRLRRFPATAFLAALTVSCAASGAVTPEQERWEQQARDVTITRDDWGIAHVRGKTNADAVFGMIYAQAEDDFNRIETNFLNAMGRLAEAEGESAVFRDLRMKLFIDPDSLKAGYAGSPDWLRALMNAWADGLNYYLSTHPTTKPRVLTRFEPWMALSFSEGSIGGDIESISIPSLRAFYGSEARSDTTVWRRPGDGPPAPDDSVAAEPSGSNGIAIAPSNTTNRRALLLINPHTSFFFRSELQMTSDEGLNAYGAVTWGQFFIYQGFNEKSGWMHTSSGVDNIDYYVEKVTPKAGGYTYRYGSEDRPVTASTIVVPFKTDSGLARREFTVYRTHHGPVVRGTGAEWQSVRLMHEPVKALTQSYRRTLAKNYKEFRETMELHTNSSNNTIFADAEGNIAYFHSNFIPKRDTSFDWSRPVDGSSPATEWGGLLSVEESPHLLNPPSGWLYNTNNWPYSAAGPGTLKQSDYPKYVESGGENARGLHAIRVLQDRKDFSLTGLRDAAYDSYLTAFDPLLPALFAAYDKTPAASPLKQKVKEHVELLRAWDKRWGVESVPTTLAIIWSDEANRNVAREATRARMSSDSFVARRATPAQLLEALAAAADTIAAKFGTWKTPWGEVNRFQRISPAIVHPFDDNQPSIPVGFTSARWGSLASFGARTYAGSKKIYGTSGNSFVAVVEFGDSVRAIAVTAGGESGDPSSKHFNDQAIRYAKGDLREVYFYPAQLKGHTERTYRPGQ